MGWTFSKILNRCQPLISLRTGTANSRMIEKNLRPVLSVTLKQINANYLTPCNTSTTAHCPPPAPPVS